MTSKPTELVMTGEAARFAISAVAPRADPRGSGPLASRVEVPASLVA